MGATRQERGDEHARERALLLGALDPEAASFAAFKATDWSGLDWNWLLERAAAHKIGTLFVDRMERSGFLPRVPGAVGERLAHVKSNAERSTQRARATLGELAEAYDRQGIPFALLKGSWLSERVYGRASLRPFGDIDLLLPEECVDEADRILIEAGYFVYGTPGFLRVHAGTHGRDPDDVSPEQIRRLHRQHHHHLMFVLREDDPRMMVELHWHLARPGLLKIGAHAVWRHTAHETVCGIPLRTLTPEASLVHVAMHAIHQTPLKFRLLHLCDVAWMVERLGPTLRAERVRDIARSWGCEQFMAAAFQVAEAVLPFALTEPERFCPRRSPLSRTLLRLAGAGPGLVDASEGGSRLGLLWNALVREACWDMALHRPPSRSVTRLYRALRGIGQRLTTTEG